MTHPVKNRFYFGFLYRRKGYFVRALRCMPNHAFPDCGIGRLYNSFDAASPLVLPIRLAAGFRWIGVKDGFRHVMPTKEETSAAAGVGRINMGGGMIMYDNA